MVGNARANHTEKKLNADNSHSVTTGILVRGLGGAPAALIILERGILKYLKMAFECSFQSFSYKSAANIPPKGGGGGWAPPLNPPLLVVESDCCVVFFYNEL